MTQDGYETELTGDRAEIAAALSGVVEGLLTGSVRVGDDEDAVAVDIPEELTLEVELEAEGDERSLELELEWEAENPEGDISAADDAIEALEEAGIESGEQPTAESAEPPAESAGDEPAESTEAEPAASTETEPAEILPVGAGDAAQSLARFELYRDRADEWRWRLRHRNGNVIASSGEGYTRKANAQKGLRSVVANAPGAVVSEESK